jgi:methylmalonyl-CoA decarboxylase
VFIDDLMQALSDLNRRTFAASFCALEPKVFSAGHDIHELPTGRRDPLSYDDPLRQITRMIQKYPKPVISMVEGSVWGGAFEMIMSSDLIIAAETSTFSMTPVNLGVPYNLVGIHNLTRDAGFHIVKELILPPHLSPLSARWRSGSSTMWFPTNWRISLCKWRTTSRRKRRWRSPSLKKSCACWVKRTP